MPKDRNRIAPKKPWTPSKKPKPLAAFKVPKGKTSAQRPPSSGKPLPPNTPPPLDVGTV